MDFINRIGQRNFAKIIFGSSVAIAVVNYIVRYFMEKNAGELINSVTPVKAIFGVVLLSAAIGILTVVAHKTKEYRMFSIFTSIIVLITNTISFYVKAPLFIMTFSEIILSIGFLIFALKSESDRKEEERKLKRRSKSNVVTGEKEIEK
jgi:ABC-type microcin C transport system permease subunit YejB